MQFSDDLKHLSKKFQNIIIDYTKPTNIEKLVSKLGIRRRCHVAYLLWLLETRSSVKKEFPCLDNVGTHKKLINQWNLEDKSIWYQKAEEFGKSLEKEKDWQL